MVSKAAYREENVMLFRCWAEHNSIRLASTLPGCSYARREEKYGLGGGYAVAPSPVGTGGTMWYSVFALGHFITPQEPLDVELIFGVGGAKGGSGPSALVPRVRE